MKNHSRNITLIALLSLATPATQIMATDTATMQTPEITAELQLILERIEHYAMQLKDKLDAFLDTRDKRSYSAHIDDFEQCYQAVIIDVLEPIDTLLANIDKGSINYKPIHDTQVILKKMAAIMNFIEKTLRANTGKASLIVAKNLNTMRADAMKKFTHVTNELAKLTKKMEATAGYHATACTVIELMEKLNNRIIKGKSKKTTELIQAIRHRCNCK